jgi:Tol biopolymer transport system component
MRDIRRTALYKEAEALFRNCRLPGTGLISDAMEVHASPCGKRAVFAGVMMDELEGTPSTRICEIDLTSADTRVLSFGPHTDRSPKYSPDGQFIAFLSDRLEAGHFQLYLIDIANGSITRPAPVVEGWI